MKSLKIVILGIQIVLLSVISANALYVETIDLCEEVPGPGCLYGIGAFNGTDLGYSHTYDNSELLPIEFVTLSIVADDVDAPNPNERGNVGEQDEVFVNGRSVGFLSMLDNWSDHRYQQGRGNDNQPLTTSVFNLNPNWFDWTDPVFDIRIHLNTNWEVEIESSTLAIQGATPVPEPATMLLFGTGLIGLVGLRKRKSI